MSNSNAFKLFISLALPLLLGAIAGMFTAEAIPGWYDLLNRPSFNPPNWIFGPVWITIYVLMGISFFLIWKQSESKKRSQAITIFLIQMGLNFAWSFIFFHFKIIGLALIEILFLWLSIILMLVKFYKINPIAAYLNLPYLLWVTFAVILNAGYYLLNK
jgi:tryptophan-rich sensory protein